MREHWQIVIDQLDKVLDIVRASWVKDLDQWAERLDILLAERFSLMQKRDAPFTEGVA